MHFWPFSATLTALPIAFRKSVWFPASTTTTTTTTTTASVVHVISERETENHFTSNVERDVESL